MSDSSISTLYDEVKQLLEQDVKYRDNDLYLTARIWFNKMKKMGYSPKTTMTNEFFMMYIDDKVPKADSITRARRKVQENNPQLRGDAYDPRQNKQEGIKGEIRDLDEDKKADPKKSNDPYGGQSNILGEKNTPVRPRIGERARLDTDPDYKGIVTHIKQNIVWLNNKETGFPLERWIKF